MVSAPRWQDDPPTKCLQALHRFARRESQANRRRYIIRKRPLLSKNKLRRQVRFSSDSQLCVLSSPHSQSPAHFANLYKDDGLTGGHVIKLGPRNDEAASEALRAWPSERRNECCRLFAFILTPSPSSIRRSSNRWRYHRPKRSGLDLSRSEQSKQFLSD